ncbi:PAS domain S-box protein [Sphingomonas oligophenolica]|uniref:histidine kinase n=1 Tax=Sphingomonas oligophenolica TaxID=301154 RepID=A0ABU9YAN4_9SPHN
MWPLTAVAYFFLVIGFGATILLPRLAPFLLAIPLLIAVCALAEGLVRISLGIDTLLFADQVSLLPAGNPGRPEVNSIVTLGLLGLALLTAARRSHAATELATLFASTAFCFGLASVALLLLVTPSHEKALRFFIGPLPGSLTTITLSMAFLLWRHRAGWIALLANRPVRKPVVWLLLPVVIALPILPTVIARWGATPESIVYPESDLLAALANVTIIGLLIWVSVDRLANQQAALREITTALDVAAIALTKPDGEITHWSRGCEQLYGWSAAEAIGRKKDDLLHSRWAQGGDGDRPSPSGSTERELVETRRDQAEISVLERTHVLDRADREPLLVVKMLDISDRVRAETALRESEARLAIAAEAQQLGVSHWDIASGRLEWSPGSEQRLGLTPGSLATFAQWEALIEPADTQGIMASVARAAANHDKRISFQYRFRGANGVMRTIEGSARCLYDSAGTLTTVIAANIDVTERKEREAAQQLRSIIDTVPDATIVIDEAGMIRSFSAAAERMFGIDSDAAIGCNIKLLMPDAVAAAHDDSIARYLVTGERHAIGSTRELTARRADGSLFPIEMNVGEARLGEERIFTGVIRDVSDRLAAEQRLNELNAELAHIGRQSAMSELAADLAHELNQPLSAAANFLAAARMLIERGENGAQVADLLRMGEEQTLRSGQIVRRLRDFLTKRDSELRPESLGLVVREAVALVLFGTARYDVRLSYRLDPAADMIFADRIQVQQVIVNLLRNAVEAMRDQPRSTREIVIASRPVEGDMVEISVTDSGPGLPDALSKNLCSRFATSKGGTAMGVGLSISVRIVEAHGGSLVAENRHGRGAVFRFTLPTFGEIGA